MNNAEQVTKAIETMKGEGLPLQSVAWQAALLCVGWAYVYGARGQYCTPANRRARYSDDHPTIRTACKNYNGSGSAGCAGCKWFPAEKLTRMFDCRGFTYYVLKAVFGWELAGAGCTSQWNNAANWKAKGEVANGIPAETLVCLFYRDKNNKNVIAHTGFAYNGQTVECSNGVQHSKTINKKWEYWAVPACIGGDIPVPDPGPKPTLRRGDRGEYVTLAQAELINQGYSCGSSGADGVFGKDTEAAVKRFQNDHTGSDGKPLKVDGIIGRETWFALDAATPASKYTVTIPHLTATQADALILQYPGSTKSEERS